MKTILYTLIALFLTANFTACTADSIADNEPLTVEEVATDGGNGHVGSEDEGGN